MKRQLLIATIAGSFALGTSVLGLAGDCGCEVVIEGTCGCEVEMPTCGCEAELPTCGCEEPICDCEMPEPACGFEMQEPACGFEMQGPGCGFEEVMPTCGCEMATCDGGCGGGKKPNVVYRSLDAVAGGIEKLFGLDKRRGGCDEATCDDGCDAFMASEMMVPMHRGHAHSTPPISGHSSAHSSVNSSRLSPPMPPSDVPSSPGIEVSPRVPANGSTNVSPMKPRQWQSSPMTKPRVVPTPMQGRSQGQHLGAPSVQAQPQVRSQPMATPAPAARTKPRTNAWPGLSDADSSVAEPESSIGSGARMAVPKPEPLSDSPAFDSTPEPSIEDDGESLFDALSDPFSDDEVHVRRYQPVRPSNYQTSRPVASPRVSQRGRELSRSHHRSSRRRSTQTR